MNSNDSNISTNGSPDPLDSMLRRVATLKPPSDAVTAAVRQLKRSVPSPTESEAWQGPVTQGEFVDDHRILRCLGTGGMGVVYLAYYTPGHEYRALKILHEKLVENTDAQARFRREVAALEQLRHPNIVRLIGSGEWQGFPYLTMEYLEHETLSAHIARSPGGRLEPSMACRFSLQLAMALAHIHDLGLLHRDVKPTNVMLNGENAVKLLDLGVAAYQEGLEQTFHTRLGTGPISLDYAAPERLEHGCIRDTSIDVYALGATMFEMLTGKPPYAFETYGSLMDKSTAIIAGRRMTLGQRRPELPQVLVQIVEEMLARDVTVRTKSAEEAAERLQRFIDGDYGKPTIATPTSSVSTPNESPAIAANPEALKIERPQNVWLVRGIATGILAASLAGLFWIGGELLNDERPTAATSEVAESSSSGTPKSPKNAEVRDLIAANRIGEALGLLNQVIPTDGAIPDDDKLKRELIELYELRAQLLASGGDRRLASRDLERLAVLDPQNARRHLELGQAKQSLGQAEAALTSFREAHRLDPKLVPAAVEVAVDAQQRGVNGEVIAALEPIQGSDELDAAARSMLAEAYFLRNQDGDSGTAEQIATAALRIDPKLVKALRIRAEVRFADGNYGEAIGDLTELIAEEPENQVARLMLARSLLELQKFDAADVEFSQVLKALPDNRLAHLGRARAIWALRDSRSPLDQAAAAGSALGFGQDNSTEEQSFLYRMRGEARLALEQWGDARSDFEELAALTPDSPEPYWNLGLASLMVRPAAPANVVQAEKALEKVMTLAPQHARTYLLSGLVADAHNREQDSVTAFEQVLELEPNDMVALRSLTRLRTKSTAVVDLDRAVDLARRLHALTKSREGKDQLILPYVLNCRAESFASKKDYFKSIADADEAVRLSSGATQSNYALTAVKSGTQAAQEILNTDNGDLTAANLALGRAKEAASPVANPEPSLSEWLRRWEIVAEQIANEQVRRDYEPLEKHAKLEGRPAAGQPFDSEKVDLGTSCVASVTLQCASRDGRWGVEDGAVVTIVDLVKNQNVVIAVLAGQVTKTPGPAFPRGGRVWMVNHDGNSLSSLEVANGQSVNIVIEVDNGAASVKVNGQAQAQIQFGPCGRYGKLSVAPKIATTIITRASASKRK